MSQEVFFEQEFQEMVRVSGRKRVGDKPVHEDVAGMDKGLRIQDIRRRLSRVAEYGPHLR